MELIKLSNLQARQFILLKQGLMGEYKFIGEKGILDFIKQAGCIQYDPIDVCGKNAELVLQSRVNGFTKEMLYNLLYNDRKLIDYFDKNMSIFPIEDWRYFSYKRNSFKEQGRSKDEIDKVRNKIDDILHQKEFVSSKDLEFDNKVDWYWSNTSLSRAALETMYFRGELIIHHKKGIIKNYALAEKHIPGDIFNADNPNKSYDEYLEWQVLRRIETIGMLWNRPSDAWLGIHELKAANRKYIFEKNVNSGNILEIQVEGINSSLYCKSDDKPLVDKVMSGEQFVGRTEFIAPLDNMLWDRKLIEAIFNFHYKWEIYTPLDQRKFGYYVLPVISGDRFVGRIEIANDKKKKELVVKNIWFEDGIEKGPDLLENIYDCIIRFSKFNNCDSINVSVEDFERII